jgi:hypothetical protein
MDPLPGSGDLDHTVAGWTIDDMVAEVGDRLPRFPLSGPLMYVYA